MQGSAQSTDNTSSERIFHGAVRTGKSRASVGVLHGVIRAATLCGCAPLIFTSYVWGQTSPVSTPYSQTFGAAAKNSSCKATISLPAFGGVIKQNPNPACFTIPGFGDIYVGGGLTGYAYGETNPFSATLAPPGVAGDRTARVDFSNLTGYLQKADGPLQFFVQGGAYSIPSLGAPIYSTLRQTELLFGPVPLAFGKFVYNDSWSIQGGRMPTLIGTEAPFTFQNLNISRGLLFNQENIVNRGVQLNYVSGPLSASVAGTDGFFSGDLSWLSGSLTYKIDDSNTVGFNGGLNLGQTEVLNRSLRYQFTTPNLQQNSGIFDVNYTYAKGPWIVSPYLQFTEVPRNDNLGIFQSASTFGCAVLASYSFTNNFTLAGRVEIESQTGTPGSGTTSPLYGAGSSAASLTITPTYTWNQYFARAEYSRVQLYNITRANPALNALGAGFGRTGDATGQDRYMFEAGAAF